MKKEIRTVLQKMLLFAGIFLFCISAEVNIHASANGEIAVDGDFSDWDSVAKTEIGDDRLNSVAFILDGDYMYVYVDACENWTAYMAGEHYNGKYTVTTDLGYQMIFQLQAENNVPVISGVDGATVAYSDLTYGKDSYCYEIAIPVSQLPTYIDKVSFGFYLQEPVINDVQNQTPEEPKADPQDNISCDGAFDDWTYYPHPVIYYGTTDEGDTYVEGQAAMYTDGEKVHAHVYSAMQTHVDNNGQDLVTGLTVTVNSNKADENGENTFIPQLVTLNSDGTINYNPDFSNLSEGVYEFYVIDMQGWKDEGVGLDYWSDPDTYWYGGNALYGKAYVSVQPSKCEMELELDVETLANKFDVEAEEMKLFSAQFAAIGSQQVSCAGASSGAWLGIVISVAVVGAVWLARRRKALA